MKWRPLRERFEEKIYMEPMSGCWLWTAGCIHDKYGMQYGRIAGDGGKFRRLELAHRVAWRLENGDIPAGMFVLHKCDTPACVNPMHLELGTHQDNMHDKARRGRATRGMRSAQTKLLDGDVNRIRKLCAAGHSQRALAREYGVAHSAIVAIVHRRTWKHLPA